MAEDQFDRLKQWYGNVRPLYEGLANTVQSTIESLLKQEKIDYLSVTARAKSSDSFLEKVRRKTYKKPEEEITDLAGVRVITFIESDVTKASHLIESSFNVSPSKSLNKTDELGIDRFGYRSVHFVCDLGKDRIKLPELSMYKDMLFEVQVRTVLQHAWAEIEHDRNYKFSGILPTHLQRRLHLLAGVLEIADREFATLASEVDQYADEVSKKALSGDLEIEVNTTSLQNYLPAKLRPHENSEFFSFDDSLDEVIIEELRDFGINSLSDLDKILSDEFFSALIKHSHMYTYVGVLRNAMLYENPTHYLDKAWKRHWSAIDDDTVSLLSEKYGRRKVKDLIKKNRINVIDEDFGEDELVVT